LNSQWDRMTAVVADLVRRRVAVIATPSTTITVAAKAATPMIPIVFSVISQLGWTTQLVSVSKLLESAESFGFKGCGLIRPGGGRCGRLRTERNTIVIT